MNRTRQSVKKRKKRKPIIKRILFFLLTVFILVIGYGAYLTYSALQAADNSYAELERGEKSKLRVEPVKVSKDPFSILLMGVEDYSSEGANGRTDSLIVATIDPKAQTMKMLSIPRDTLVYQEERGKEDKINHAYAFGGKEATINAVESLLDIPVDYYATVNFNGFKEIIDEIGGVTVDVPFDFWEKSDITGKHLQFYEGEMDLDGEEALAYARMRKRDPRGDFGRNDRQKQIITAAIDQVMKPNNLLKIDDIASHIGENIETNLRVSEALGLQQSFGSFNSSKIEQLSIEGSDEYLSGVYYFIPDEEELDTLKTDLKSHLKHTNQSDSVTE